MENKNAHTIAEWIRDDCNREILENIAKNAGYKNPRKMSLIKLEAITFVDKMCGDIIREHYRIFDDVTGEILVNRCGKKYMIDWILKNCLFNWYDEQERPVRRDSFHHEIRVDALRR